MTDDKIDMERPVDPASEERVEARAQTFRRLREEHAREMAEDYVEMIAELIEEEGEARAVSLAERFGVTAATVANTLRRLKRDGLITNQPYRSIFLTDEGRKLADACKARHDLVCDFLIAVGVDPETAAEDTEGIEHHCSEETLAVFQKYLDQRR